MSRRKVTELRSQLLAAREEHRSVRYAGDLAFDVLPGRMSIALRRVGWMAAASAAIAGTIAVSVWLRHLPPAGTAQPSPGSPSLIAQAADETYTPFAAAEAPEFPTDIQVTPTPPSDVSTFVPSYQAMAVESVPSFPSFDTVLEQQKTISESTNTSTTQEPS